MGYPNKLGFYRDGLYRQNVKEISTVSTGVSLKVEDSGMTYFVPIWTTGRIHLPRVSSKWLGVEYTIYVTSQASSDDISITADKYNTSAKIHMNFSSVISVSTGASLGSTFATGIRLTALTSVVWMGQPITANSYSMSSAATDNLSGWVVGVSS